MEFIVVALAANMARSEVYTDLGSSPLTLWQSLGIVFLNDRGSEIHERGRFNLNPREN